MNSKLGQFFKRDSKIEKDVTGYDGSSLSPFLNKTLQPSIRNELKVCNDGI
jgi:hypothetical protein